jgi:pyrimidine-nucleoside phosphorylase
VTWDPRGSIETKRDGGTVAPDELRRLIAGYVDGTIDEGPMAAFLMACVIHGLNDDETSTMTQAFVDSGTTLLLDDVDRPVVDKHSTGGVSDGVSLIFAPLVAALGLACVKLAGRGLGHTGGTVDKLESIPGMRLDRSLDEITAQARAIGCVIASQTDELVPADGAIYALRDATATVRSVPLIAASVMAKKLAVRSDLILLDVKAGSGAFMRDTDEAAVLARTCLAIARDHDRRAVAAVTDMSQPLGDAIGNALEVSEAVAVLNGGRAGRLRDLSVELAARALCTLADVEPSAARSRAAAALDGGTAADAFRRMVEAQDGDRRVVDDPDAVLPRAPITRPLSAHRAGTLGAVDAAALGEAARALGAGRSEPGDPIDPAVGIVLTPKVGDRLEDGQPIGWIHAREEGAARAADRAVAEAISIVDGAATAPALVHRWLEEVS